MFKTIRRWTQPSPEAQWFAGRFAYCDTCIAESRSHLRFAAGDIAVHERDFGHAFEPLAERWEALALEVARARARWPGNRNRMAAILGETNEALHAFSEGDYASARGESLQVAATAMRLHWEGDAQEARANDLLEMCAALDGAVSVLQSLAESYGLVNHRTTVEGALVRGRAALDRAYDADGYDPGPTARPTSPVASTIQSQAERERQPLNRPSYPAAATFLAQAKMARAERRGPEGPGPVHVG